VIEAGSQVVDAITEDGTPLDWNALMDAQAVNILACLRIFVGDKLVRAAFFKFPDSALEIVDVAFGPFEFLASDPTADHSCRAALTFLSTFCLWLRRRWLWRIKNRHEFGDRLYLPAGGGPKAHGVLRALDPVNADCKRICCRQAEGL